MKDLTEGSVTKHLLHMASFMAVSIFVSTLYVLADLFWVGHLGKEAIAAVSVATNLMMFVMGLVQMLSVGTMTLISHATGEKDQKRAELIFNQSLVMSIAAMILLAGLGFLLRNFYCDSLSADATTATLAKAYLNWFLPAMLLQFPLAAMGAALRATGIIKPSVALQVLSVGLNIALAPLLIFGLGPFPKLGVAGAGLATFIAILIADLLMLLYFERKYHYLRFRERFMRPQMAIWGKMLRIGVPAGTEFILLFVYVIIIYEIIRNFGPAAQAGFGAGSRIMQALFLPVVALSFGAAPVIGQNFGGRRADRVRQAIYSAIGLASAIMLVLTLIAHFLPATLIRPFSADPDVIAFGSDYLRIASLTFIGAGIVFTTSSIFQGIGNTWPPLLSSMTRLLLFVLPSLLLSRTPGFQIKHIWYLSVGSQLIQAAINLLLLQRELRRKLNFPEIEATGTLQVSQPGVA